MLHRIAVATAMLIAAAMATGAHAQTGLRTTSVDGSSLPPGVLTLTYDDGPTKASQSTTDGTIALAQYLKSEGIRATFFVVPDVHLDDFQNPKDPADRLSQTEAILPDVVSRGHRAGNHSRSHWGLHLVDGLPPRNPVDQISLAHDVLNNATVTPDKVFLLRVPGGLWDDTVKCVSIPPNPPITQAELDVCNRVKANGALLRNTSALNPIVGPIFWTISGNGQDAAGNKWGSDIDCARSRDAAGLPLAQAHTLAECVAPFFSGIGPNDGTPLGTNQKDRGIVLMHDYIRVPDGFDEDDHAKERVDYDWPTLQAQALIPWLKQRKYLLLPIDVVPELPGGQRFNRTAVWSANFADTDGFSNLPGYYGTVRYGDLNADGKDDVCVRGAAGLFCNRSNGASFEAGYSLWLSAMSDAQGWSVEAYSTSVQLADLNADNKADVCALAYQGVWCALSSGAAFVGFQEYLPEGALPPAVRTEPDYFRTFRLADINGDNRADVCVRAKDGLYCGLMNDTTGKFNAMTLVLVDVSNTNGWEPAKYGHTLQFGNVDGVAGDEVCARGYMGIYCASFSTGSGLFQNFQRWSAGATYPNFSDFDGFDEDVNYFGTFRLGDVTKDGKADACIRSKAGLLCARSTGTAFDAYEVWQKLDLADTSGWKQVEYSSSIGLADIDNDGELDVCGRKWSGIHCAVNNPIEPEQAWCANTSEPGCQP